MLNPETKGRVIPSAYVVRLQRRHVLLCNILPLLGSLAAIALIPLAKPGVSELSLGVVMWALTLGVGGTVGFHRYFTHRSFNARIWLRYTLAILGSMAGQGSVIAWVITHRRHHEFSDSVGDPHSPQIHEGGAWNNFRGLWHAQFGWLWEHDMPNPIHYAPDLLKDRKLVWINRTYYYWVVIGLVVPAIANGLILGTWIGILTGLFWIGAVRMFVTSQLISSINSVCHMFGTRRYSTAEQSRNNVWLAIPTFGESWHNNHHAAPSNAAFGHRWWEIDLGWLVILGLKAFGLIWEVRQHSPSHQTVVATQRMQSPN